MTSRSGALALAAALAQLGAGAACVAPAAPPEGPGAVAGSATAPTAPAVVSAAPDWTAAPTNGSPGLDVPKLSGHDLIANADFASGKYVPWTTSFTAPGNGRAFVAGGELCVEVTNKGANPWDAQARHREMIIEKGHTYSIQFMAHATRPTRMKAKLGMAGPPYKEYWSDTLDLTTHPQTFVGTFTMSAADDPTAELAFHLGGDMAAETQTPFSVCLDDIHLDDPRFTRARAAEAAPIARVLVNQVGYFPRLPKLATIKSASAAPLEWKLRAASGAVVASGRTAVVGLDAAAGEKVHLADFSSVKTPGRGYVLVVGADESHPFAIEEDLYARLQYDALAYFFHNRSGVPIELPYAREAKWTRPAGHVGDRSVGCAPARAGGPPACPYKLDVSGGWYDAGDHGKYVVNGGIAAWTLMNEWESAEARGAARAFADGTMSIPERRNGAPDLLDEARVELEFMLKMQVPEGQPNAGMVHHKIHDKDWTALGTAPHEDTQERLLYPPSTAATLNLAAVAAQGARLWRKLDPKFAERCLTAAKRAWAAALAHPAEYAASGGVGGGPYDDRDVSDERYWAAAELFISTAEPSLGEPVGKTMRSSPYFCQVPTTIGGDGVATSMTWDHVQALGTISLALSTALPAAERATCRAAVRAAAERYVALMRGQGYRVPFAPGEKGFPWGSNSFVLNNAVVLGLADDFFHDARYRDAAADAMSYLLGRNPLDQSYVTGYGARPLEHPHHRFWAHQANARFPPPPPGAVSGGPNSGLQDPYAQAAGLAGCAPEACFVDNIEAWSVNEIAINWNAPLAWVAAFLDERAR
ncbi:MAG TPA: glycoside hydrolase family 9 protein [Polyangia bacterium]|nr:glycoside hydrolase family 9 protein [Polyangia bacterium]